MIDLKECREEIDRIDQEIVEKLEERMRVAEQIGRYKKEQNRPITDLLREREKIDSLTELASEDLASYIRLLYFSIMEMSKDHQRKTLKMETPLVKEITESLDATARVFPSKAVVACQGVPGAYSQQACEKVFKIPQIVYMKNFHGVFAAIEQGLCEYGILPLENSTAGSVNQIYDLMMQHHFYIVKSVKMKIDHNLLAIPGVKKEEIKEVFSHEQAILQCEEYLKQMPGVKITICENTAEAAKEVAQSGRKDAAALASYACGKLYGLDCVEEGVQDHGNNYTRFICISKKMELYPGADKTSLMMVLSHKPGALYHVLSRFYSLGLNLLKLESRPIPNRDFQFMFYFDIECQVYSEEFIRLMSQLEELSDEFRYLGSYMEI